LHFIASKSRYAVEINVFKDVDGEMEQRIPWRFSLRAKVKVFFI